MSFDYAGTGPSIIRLGGSGFYNDPRLDAKLSHPGLAFERSRNTSHGHTEDGEFGYRRLGHALVVMESESTCFGVA